MRSIAALVLAAATIACGTSPASVRPSTTYDAYNYVVSIPDDLGLSPISSDPETVWLTGPKFFTRSKPAATLNIRVGQLDPAKVALAKSDAEVAMELATENLSAVSATVVTAPTAVELPAGAGVTAEAKKQDVTVSVVYLVSGERGASFTATGLTLADVVAVARTFGFRDPPGDPLRPPSRSP
jgi:hypothetical protein